MNPNNYSPSNPQKSNPQNSQFPNIQYPYSFPNSYFPYAQNSNVDNSQFSNLQNPNYNPQTPNSQFPFPNPYFSYPQNSHFPFVQNFQNIPPQFGTQQTPISNENSPHSQASAFDATNIIDLNDDVNEVENTREGMTQWKWSEDKLLISAWLNVSTDPITGADQKSEAFWDRIRQYCEESNPGLIKRGAIAIKKRWQRINEGAQKYGSCYEQAERRAKSGSNLDNIIEAAHDLHKTKYKKKSNFELHWSELRRQPKWRTPTSSRGSGKRTKLSDSGAYSSSMNDETHENVVESPVRPKGTKAAKKGKGKAKKNIEAEYEELKADTCRKLDLIEKFNDVRQKDLDLRVLMADTTIMNDTQREIHAKMLADVKSRMM